MLAFVTKWQLGTGWCHDFTVIWLCFTMIVLLSMFIIFVTWLHVCGWAKKPSEKSQFYTTIGGYRKLMDWFIFLQRLLPGILVPATGYPVWRFQYWIISQFTDCYYLVCARLHGMVYCRWMLLIQLKEDLLSWGVLLCTWVLMSRRSSEFMLWVLLFLYCFLL